MKKVFFAATLACSLFFASCEKNELENPNTALQTTSGQQSNQRQRTQEDRTVTYHFKETTYTIDATIFRDNGEVVEITAANTTDYFDLQEALSSYENIGLFFKSDKDFYLYSNASEFADIQKSFYGEMSNQTRDLDIDFYTCQPFYQMYEHVNFTGQLYFDAQNGSGMMGVLPTYSPEPTACYNVPWVGSNVNDKISSIKIKGGEMISMLPNPNHIQFLWLYEHINYGGNNISFSSDGCDELDIANLKEWTMWEVLFFGDSWNDKISSFQAGFGLH